MSDASIPADTLRTAIWQEEPEPGNPFAARSARCHGYDVYGQMLPSARWVEMLFLLLRGEAPDAAQAALLETLAVALANPGPRDASVHAAMCAGVGGSPAAACLVAALSVGAGRRDGARDVFLAMTLWQHCGTELAAWRARLREPVHDLPIWPESAQAPGFDPHGAGIPGVVLQALQVLASRSPGPRLPWLLAHHAALQDIARGPLTLAGVAAAAFADLGFAPEEGEMLHLLLRLPGAAAHALEQARTGHKRFPFFSLSLQDDPQQRAAA